MKLVNLNYVNHQLNFVIIVHDIIPVVDRDQDREGTSFSFLEFFSELSFNVSRSPSSRRRHHRSSSRSSSSSSSSSSRHSSNNRNKKRSSPVKSHSPTPEFLRQRFRRDRHRRSSSSSSSSSSRSDRSSSKRKRTDYK